MRKMCKKWVDCYNLKDNRWACGDRGYKCPKNTNSKCEIVKSKDKWVVVKGWAWVDIMNRVVAASVNKSGSIIPCEIRVRAKDLEGK